MRISTSVLSALSIVIISCAIIGCSYTNKQGPSQSSARKNARETLEIDFKYFNKDGHQWIYFTGKDVWPGVIHSPECDCK